MTNPNIDESGKFKSGEYDWCPPGFVPLKLTDTRAQDLLARYAIRRQVVDVDFSNALLSRLFAEGYAIPESVTETAGTGVEMIAEERRRQIDGEGFSAERDDEYTNGELVRAATTYALASAGYDKELRPSDQSTLFASLKEMWPWYPLWFKPKSALHDLARAGALIAAEIDRRVRAGVPK